MVTALISINPRDWTMKNLGVPDQASLPGDSPPRDSSVAPDSAVWWPCVLESFGSRCMIHRRGNKRLEGPGIF
jgi:hypothetical protein